MGPQTEIERKANELARRIFYDLDRCEHGRHEGDVCSGKSGCNGPSKGNPHIKEGDVIGYTLHGTHQIVVPSAELRHVPEAWIVPRS